MPDLTKNQVVSAADTKVARINERFYAMRRWLSVQHREYSGLAKAILAFLPPMLLTIPLTERYPQDSKVDTSGTSAVPHVGPGTEGPGRRQLPRYCEGGLQR